MPRVFVTHRILVKLTGLSNSFVPDSVATTLKALDVLREIPADRIVATLDEARVVARECLLA